METTTDAQLRSQLEDLQKKRVREARRSAIWVGVVSIVALLCFVYGYVQHIAGEKLAERAAMERQEALMIQDKAEKQMAEAELALKKMEQLTIELEICKASKK